MGGAMLAAAVDRIARAERCLTVEVAFRIGLCAAADALDYSNPLRTSLLFSAGVDPAEWEKARAT
jgi:hypothetical protein